MVNALERAGFDTDEVDEYQYFWQFCSLGIPGQLPILYRAHALRSS